MQTVQIDKLGAAPFDGTTLVDPAVNPSITVQNIPGENRTVITVPAAVAAGQFDIGALLGIPADNAYVIHDISVGGDFAAPAFTGALLQILGLPNPINTGRSVRPFAFGGANGIGILGGSQWVPPGGRIAITTDVGDTGPYRVVLLVEELPNQKLISSMASGMIS